MKDLTRFAWLSIAAAIATIALKGIAYLLTGSVGLLSDALESLVNLVAASVALVALTVAVRPPDKDHPFGHSKAEYFASATEGALILLAAVSIALTAVERMIHPHEIQDVGLGLAISVVATTLNFVVAGVLYRAGRKHNSIALESDAKHIMTDVWTSVGVVLAVGAVAATGWQILDPLIALVVAANIVWSGIQLLRRSAGGLMDASLPEGDQAAIRAVLKSYSDQGIQYHALRTRQAGARQFMMVHILVPGEWTVEKGHAVVEEIEARIRDAVPQIYISAHMEPVGDPAPEEDLTLDPETGPREGADVNR